MKIIYIILLFFYSIIFINAQEFDTLWTNVYGGTENDVSYYACETFDSSYIFIGYTSSYGNGYKDLYIIKINTNGDTLWTKTYGGVSDDGGYAIHEINSGYILSGFTASYGAGSYDFYLLKTNYTGDTIWSKTYGGINSDVAYGVLQLSDGGFFIIGYTMSYGAGNEDIYLVRTDSLGDTLWTKTYGGANDDSGVCILKNGSGYLILGNTESYGNYQDIYLIQINANGDILWTKTYGGVDLEYAQYMIKDNNQFLIIGGSISYGAGSYDYYVLAIDTLGDTLWTKTYGKVDLDFGTSICKTGNGYLIGGYSNSFSTGDYDGYIIAIDTIGNKIDSLIISAGFYDDVINFLFIPYNEYYMFFGYSNSIGAGGNDIYIGKINYNTLGINEKNEDSIDIKINQFESENVDFYIDNPNYKNVNLNIYNITGQLIAIPIKNEAINEMISYTPKTNGIYFYKIEIGSVIKTGKIIIF